MTTDNPGNEQTPIQAGYQPCDTRYRNSRYFLEDQLKCSDAVADFKAMKELIDQLGMLRLTRALGFKPAPVLVPSCTPEQGPAQR
ncbi:MAG: hypothetical protein AB7P76_00510 [Candidatus Melainabacteria bacterium]